MSDFIKNWQKANGLLDDGIIGEKTLLKIKEVLHIPTIEAVAHFIGNTHHETGGFIRFEENLNYSSRGLLQTFPKYFKTLAEANEAARKPQKIANIVYGGRIGNDTFNDGWKFRGRGALQTTGKNNYRLLGDFLGVNLVSDPNPVATKYALESAVFYFESNKLWDMCSTVTDASIRKVRKAVNGGSIGLEDASEKVKMYYKILKS
jgi:putative chitinase